MSKLDTRQEALTAEPGQHPVRLSGMWLILAAAALSGTSLAVAMEPGLATLGGKKQQIAGRASLTVHSGGTLADGSSIRSAAVVYLNPRTNRMYVEMVDGEAATTGEDELPSDETIEAAIPSSVEHWTLAGGVRFSRSGTAISVQIDHTVRSMGVLLDDPHVASGADEQAGATGALWKPHSTLRFPVDAADIANGDILTNYPLPLIHGRIPRWRAVVTKAITTVSKTATLNLEIGTTDVTSTATVYNGVKALGVVTALTAPTAANTFVPGDTLSIEAASVTAFIEGRVMIEVDIEEAVA